MKWNSRAKLTATATSALLFTLLLASCSNNNNNDTNVQLPVNSPVLQEQTQEEQIDNGKEQANDDSDDSSTEVEPTPVVTQEPTLQDSTLYEATGIYVGAIDSRSIEVTVNGEPTVFLLNDDFSYVISDFNESEKVTIKYNKEKTDDGNYIQNIVTEISVAK